MADFDFNTAEEEELQYKTFWERLRESFGKLSFCLILHSFVNSNPEADRLIPTDMPSEDNHSFGYHNQ